MIRSFRCKKSKRLFDDRHVSRFQAIQRQARRKLEMLNAAASLEDLARVPGNRFEALRGDREGQYSIRINAQWRLCFCWTGEEDATDVEIVDYH